MKTVSDGKHHEEYDFINVDSLAPDPADYAEQNRLVGCHDVPARRMIGAWRWPLVWEYRNQIIPLIQGRYALDWGGAAGPIGYGAVVVDRGSPYQGFRTLEEVEPGANCIFTSHTLEHVVDLKWCLDGLVRKLDKFGRLIIHVPGWRIPNLREENWPHHYQTFCLSGETEAPEHYTRLDTLLSGYGNLDTCMDDSRGNILSILKLS